MWSDIMYMVFATALLIMLVLGWWNTNNHCRSLEAQLKEAREILRQMRRHHRCCDVRYRRISPRRSPRISGSPSFLKRITKLAALDERIQKEQTGSSAQPANGHGEFAIINKNDIAVIRRDQAEILEKMNQIMKRQQIGSR